MPFVRFRVSKSAQTLKDKVPAKEHGKPARKTAWSENGDSISNVAVASEANGFGGSEARCVSFCLYLHAYRLPVACSVGNIGAIRDILSWSI